MPAGGAVTGCPRSDARRGWVGGPERDRTADLLIANEALSQLSYRPQPRAHGPFGRPYQVGAIYGAGWGESRIGRYKAVLAACLAGVEPVVWPDSANPTLSHARPFPGH